MPFQYKTTPTASLRDAAKAATKEERQLTEAELKEQAVQRTMYDATTPREKFGRVEGAPDHSSSEDPAERFYGATTPKVGDRAEVHPSQASRRVHGR